MIECIPNHILFDGDGVLQFPGPGVASRLQDLIGSEADISAFVSELFQAEHPGLSGTADFLQAIEPVLERWHVTQSAREVLDTFNDIVTLPGAKELVGDLQDSGITCSLATNQNIYRAQFMETSLVYVQMMDHRYFSCHLKYQKPEHSYFQAILADLDVPAKKVLFVDDRSENTEAADRLGLQALHFDGTGKSADDLRRGLREFGLRC